MDEMDIEARTEFVEIADTCDQSIDEHTSVKATGETCINEADHLAEVRLACQCGDKGYWITAYVARQHGYID